MSWLPSSWTSTRPGIPGLGLLDLEAFGQAQPDRRMRRRRGLGQGRQRLFATALEAVDAQVERRARQQRRLRAGIDQRIEPLEQPGGGDAGLRRPPRPSTTGIGPCVEPSNKGEQVRILAGKAEHRGTARNRALAGAADGAEDQLADRAPVLRAGIAAGLEIAGDDRVGRGPALAGGER